MIEKIRKRDGSVVPFQPQKISQAIYKATLSVGRGNRQLAEELARKVVRNLEKTEILPTVEDVQEMVERALILGGYAEIAKSYILYRKRRTEVREAKKFLGVRDDLKLSVNAAKVLERRYLRKDDKGRVMETPREMFRRVAQAIASVEEGEERNYWEEEFFRVMSQLLFLPNSPTLMNANTPMGQLSACFVLPVEDSIQSIFDSVKNMALIHQSGGGTGFSFSRLRPQGDIVSSTGGVASGPVSFMRAFDVVTEVIKQGGRRRGANMGILRVDHPDILEFITAKEKEGFLENFNLSVTVSDSFMEGVKKNRSYYLINPRTGNPVKQLKAREVFDHIITSAWRCGDPGLIFLDEVNRHNPTPHIGEIESTNPCGEQPLLPYESCNLGSVNLARMVRNGEIDWEKLREVVRVAVRFLDDVIEVNKFPLPEIERMTRGNRKIGLGVMGFAELLIQLGISYDSEEGLKVGEEVMKFISREAREISRELGRVKGSFPNFPGSIWDKKGFKYMRNASLTTIAPTGTISIIAGCSSGIEPLFAVCFLRDVLEGTKLLEINPFFEKIAKEKGFYSQEMMTTIARSGSLKGVRGIPSQVRRLFVTALDIKPEWHIRMQAAFQKYTDNAVSKTVNLPQEATLQEVRKAYLLAYRLKCKGITIYRYGSRKRQVFYLGDSVEKFAKAHSEYAGECRVCAV